MNQEWYYVDGATQTQQGPFSVDELGKLFAISGLTGSTLVWRDGLEAWSPLSMAPSLHARVTLAWRAFRSRSTTLAGEGTHDIGGGIHAATPASGVVVESGSGEVKPLWGSLGIGCFHHMITRQNRFLD